MAARQSKSLVRDGLQKEQSLSNRQWSGDVLEWGRARPRSMGSQNVFAGDEDVAPPAWRLEQAVVRRFTAAFR